MNTLSSGIDGLVQRVKSTADQNEKIDLLADMLDKANRMFVLHSELLLNVKNVTVANVLLSDDVSKLLEKYLKQR